MEENSEWREDCLPALPAEAEPEPPAAEQAQGTHNDVVPGSNVPESDWEVGDSGDCHQCVAVLCPWTIAT